LAVTLRQRIRFYQQLAVLIRAGLPIRATFTRLSTKISSREVAIVARKLDAGERLGEGFADAGFTPFETHLVAAGERSGKLETIFEHLSQFWSRELEMRQALLSPLYYPIVVLHLALVLGAGVELLTLPLPVVVFHFVLAMGLLYFFGALAYVIVRFTWSSNGMRRFWMRVPIIGRTLKTASAYRWISALRLEFGAGISLYRAVGDAWRASDYINADRYAAEGEQSMLAGAQLSALVQGWRQLPRDWVDFVETAEIAGAFDEAFKSLEEEASRAWTQAQQRMTEWVPKILYFFVLLIVAVVVGRIMYQVTIAPIVEVNKVIDDATR
jgi:type IV pilus assembly protein PilC